MRLVTLFTFKFRNNCPEHRKKVRNHALTCPSVACFGSNFALVIRSHSVIRWNLLIAKGIEP
ncbi:MAG: hypothetical protein DWH78_00960 [Planctomycetota bacterium]|nr:MAG: hypothetical protein DWH78_00960 [Planctomycetota bacterium]